MTSYKKNRGPLTPSAMLAPAKRALFAPAEQRAVAWVLGVSKQAGDAPLQAPAHYGTGHVSAEPSLNFLHSKPPKKK